MAETVSSQTKKGKLTRKILEAEIDLAGVRAAFEAGNASAQQLKDAEEYVQLLQRGLDKLVAEESEELLAVYISERNEQADAMPNPLRPRQ